MIGCAADDDSGPTGMERGPDQSAEGGAFGLVGCEFGEDAQKCGSVANQSCLPRLQDTATHCELDVQCDDGALCFVEEGSEGAQGECLLIVGECVERCGGDFDCNGGLYCNPKTGRCTEEPPRGLRAGESCKDSAQCKGHCVELSDGSGECEEYCRVGADSGCGHMSLSGSGFACAYFAFDLMDIDVQQGAGDTGICAQLCDCSDECPGAQLCFPLPTDGRAGICTGGVDAEEALDCEGQ